MSENVNIIGFPLAGGLPPGTVVVPLNQHEATVASFRDLLAASNESRDEAQDKYRKLLGAVQDTLATFADDHDLHDRFNEMIDWINGDLGATILSPICREYEVTVKATVYLTQTIRAANAEQAGESVCEDLTTHDLYYNDGGIEEVEVERIEPAY